MSYFDVYFTAHIKNKPGSITRRPFFPGKNQFDYNDTHTLVDYGFWFFQHYIWSAWAFNCVDEELHIEGEYHPTETILSKSRISAHIDHLKLFTGECSLLEKFEIYSYGLHKSDPLEFPPTEEDCVDDLGELIELLESLLEEKDFDFLKISVSYG